MIKMTIQFLYWEVRFIAKCAHDFFIIISFLVLAAITEINLLLWNFGQSVACQVKTCITRITVKDLVRIVIETTEAYFAICLKKLFLCYLITFGWTKHLLILDECLEH
jgi:hypothetical protein